MNHLLVSIKITGSIQSVLRHLSFIRRQPARVILNMAKKNLLVIVISYMLFIIFIISSFGIFLKGLKDSDFEKLGVII